MDVGSRSLHSFHHGQRLEESSQPRSCKNSEEAAQLNDVYSKRGSLAIDGRPTLNNTTPAEFADATFSTVPSAVLVTAHSWTPWFGVFGSRGGYNNLEEAYEEHAKRVTAIETGMSSDPAMNWRVSFLDSVGIISSSDAHSPHPWRIGREANVFDFEKPSFDSIWKAVKARDGKHFKYTIEVDPNYGKYHWDGHRAHNISMPPEETKKHNGICPVCKKKLTLGVEYRIDELADRPHGYVPKDAVPFKKLLPLHELIANAHSTNLYNQAVMKEADALIDKFGNELSVLLETSENELAKVTHEKIARVIILNREGKIHVKPGYDGEYGVPELPKELIVREARAKRVKPEEPRVKGQLGLDQF